LFPNGKPSKPLTLSAIAIACLGYLIELRTEVGKIDDRLENIEAKITDIETERKIKELLEKSHTSLPPVNITP
jgi:hypothetical protein